MVSQKNKIRLAVAGIFLMAVFGLLLDFPQIFEKAGFKLPGFLNWPFHLGLDLQGGTHLVYQADVSQIPGQDQASAVEGVRDVIERRVNAFGVSAPIVQTTKSGDSWRMIVELAGVSDVNQAITMIGETPLLEFKEQNPSPQIELTDEQKQQLTDFNNRAKTLAEDLLVQALKPDADFGQLAKDNSQDPGSLEAGGDLGLMPRGVFVPEFEKVCFDELKPGEIYRSEE